MKPLALPLAARILLDLTLPAAWREDIKADLCREAERLAARRGRRAAVLWLYRQSLAFAWRFQAERWRKRWERLAPIRWRPITTRLSRADLKLVTRQFRRTPVFLLTSVLALAAAIGMLATAWTFCSGVLLGKLPFEDADRFVAVADLHRSGGYRLNMGPERFDYLRRNSRSFEALGAYSSRRLSFESEEGAAAVASAAYVTPQVLEMTGVFPQQGRRLRSQDLSRREAVAVISEDFWLRRLGARRQAMGSVVRVGGVEHIVIGVMPADFAFPDNHDLWLPLDLDSGQSSGAQARLKVVGKLEKTVTAEQASSELFELTRRRPVTGYQPEEIGQEVLPFVRAAIPQEMTVVFGLVLLLLGLVLLVVAANVANLLLARTAARSGELAVRKAMGARRRDIFGLLFLEALSIGLAASVLGAWATDRLLQWMQVQIADLPFWIDLSFRPTTMAVIAASVVGASALVALLPSWKAAGADLHGVLKTGGGISGLSHGRLSRALVVSELALSVGFLGTASAVSLDLLDYSRRQPGAQAEEVAVAQLYFGQPPPPAVGMSREEHWALFLEQVEIRRHAIGQRIARMPGVEEVAFGTHVPGYQLSTSLFQSEQPAGAGEGAAGTVNVVYIDDRYFALLGHRASSSRWDQGTSDQVLVNEPFSRHYLSSAGVGKRLRLAGGRRETAGGTWGEWLEVAGVVPDLGVSPFDPSQAPTLYRPWQPTNIMLMLVRGRGDSGALAADLHAVMEEADSQAELQWAQPLTTMMDAFAEILRRLSLGLLVLGALALLLSAAGLYSIASLSVVKRQSEIGLRAALGAGRSRLLYSTLAPGLRQLGLGALIGAVLAVLLKGLLYSIYYSADGGGGADWWLLGDYGTVTAAATLLMAAVGLLAFLLPARRILSISPAQAIRHE